MKKIILFLALFCAAVSANAQTAIETPKFLDNWYVGVNGGATTNLDFNKVFPWNATLGAVLGKDFSPVFGAQLEYVSWLGDANFANSHTSFKANNLGVNGTVNLSNLFFGYKGVPRKFEVTGVTGIGWLHIYGDHNLDGTYGREDNDELTAKTAVNLAWNLGKNKAHQIYVQPAINWNLTNGRHDYVHFNKHNAQIGLSVGYIYKFKTSNGTHNFKMYDVGAMMDEIDYLNRELAKKPKRVEFTKEVEKIVNVETNTQWVIQFAQASCELTDEAKSILDGIGENLVVNIEGYASPEGTDDFNKFISSRRAEVVAAYLMNRGIKVNDWVGKGVVFGPSTNRLAVVTVAQ